MTPDEIRDEIDDLEYDLLRLNDEIDDVEQRIEELRALCPHPEWESYVPDGAHRMCKNCGMIEWTRPATARES